MADQWTRTNVATTTKATAITGVAIVEVGALDIQKLDLKDTVNSAARLFVRLRLTPEYSGASLRYKVDALTFVSSASQTYADDDTTPFTDAEADNVTTIGFTPAINLETLYTNAGDTYP